MNFKSVLNDVCCDYRIKNGTINLKNEDHVFVLQEYLEKAGFDIETIVDKTAKLFETGRFPERQAYNKDGILVTFPSKEYRDRAINKGTHFAENPKKAQANIFTQPPIDIQPEEPKGSVPVDTELDKDLEDEKEDGYEDRTPKEKVVDAQAVDAILTGETPLVNYSVDEVKRYGFYNKGMLWYDTEGNLIGEQIFDEKVGTKVVAKKINSNFLKLIDETKRNAEVLETLPLLKCFGVNTYQDLVNFVTSGNIDKYDFTDKGKMWLKKVISNLNDEESKNSFIDFYNQTAGTSQTLNNITNQPVTSFIHKNIINYRKILKQKTNTDDESKANTSDIILIYGGSKEDLISNLSKITSEQDLLINDDGTVSFKKNPSLKFSQVSLKKGDAKLGKITKKFFSMIGDKPNETPIKEIINEGLVTDFLTGLKNKINTAGQNLSKKMSNIYNWFSSKINAFYESVITIFRSIPMNEIEQEDKNLEKFTAELEQSNIDSNQSIKELSDNEIPITNCNYLAMTQFYDFYKKIGFKNLIQQYKILSILEKSGGFSLHIGKIDENHYNQIDLAIKKIYDIFYTAAKSKNFFKIQELNEAKECIYTGKNITREQIEPALKLRANHIALRKIDELIKSVQNNSKSTEIDVKDLPSLAATLSAEAVFGDNNTLPLFKFTGSQLIDLGNKQSYITKKREQFKKLDIKDINLGYINIYPTLKEDALHFQVYMYLLFDLDGDELTLSPMYSEIAFTVGSGSKFAFNIEMNGVVSHNEIKSKLK